MIFIPLAALPSGMTVKCSASQTMRIRRSMGTFMVLASGLAQLRSRFPLRLLDEFGSGGWAPIEIVGIGMPICPGCIMAEPMLPPPGVPAPAAALLLPEALPPFDEPPRDEPRDELPSDGPPADELPPAEPPRVVDASCPTLDERALEAAPPVAVAGESPAPFKPSGPTPDAAERCDPFEPDGPPEA